LSILKKQTILGKIIFEERRDLVFEDIFRYNQRNNLKRRQKYEKVSSGFILIIFSVLPDTW
jgi:hypothetical protein